MGNDSLIQREQSQPQLFSSAEMEDRIFEESERKGEFTAERLFKKNLTVYRAIVTLLGEGRGQIWIGALFSISPNTVRAVAKREGLAVAAEKERLAEKAFGAAHLAIESVAEDLANPETRSKISTKDKALVGGILVDKGLLLAGEATVRVDIGRPVAPEHEDFNAYLEKLKSAAAMGGEAEKLAQKGVIDVEATEPGADPGATQAEPGLGSAGADPAAPGQSFPDTKSELQPAKRPANTHE